jgi:glycosyltransferase involved in cell wall biosynthesis
MSGILIMISYEADIGFAIGRLVSAFYEMAVRLTGDKNKVHFSFGKVAGRRSNALPDEFDNLLEFDYNRHDEASLQRFESYIEAKNIDVIFALDMSVRASCLKAARKAGVKKVVSYWGAPMSSINHGLKLAIKRLEVAWLRRHKPDHFIFESHAMRRFGVDGRGLRSSNTSVVATGVDAEKFRPMPDARTSVYQRFSIPVDRKVVVYMGHLHRRKGVHVLMMAADKLVSDLGRQDIHVLFLGNRGEEHEAFTNEVGAAGKFVTFGGYQSDIPELLAGCYIGCIPSTGWDSFPMSSLEMQACGLPVVVSDWQGVPETIANGETGVAVPVGDAGALARSIAEMVDDPIRRDRMSIAARARIESGFTIQHQVNSLYSAMSEILGAERDL